MKLNLYTFSWDVLSVNVIHSNESDATQAFIESLSPTYQEMINQSGKILWCDWEDYSSEKINIKSTPLKEGLIIK